MILVFMVESKDIDHGFKFYSKFPHYFQKKKEHSQSTFHKL